MTVAIPPLSKAQEAAAQLGLAVVREPDHDHLQAAEAMAPLDFAGRLLAYCYRFRGSVTSWGRTHAYNASPKIEGVPNSKHQTWLAGDVVYD